jgi:hypothetical protein
MHPNAQIFGHQLLTLTTALAGIPRVNQYDALASLFRFARRVPHELIPRRIRYAFRQTVVFEHPLRIQVLKNKRSETIEQLPAFLMGKVRALICDPLVDASDNFSAFRPIQTTLFSFGQFPLHFRQFVFFSSEKARIGDLLTIRQGSERREAKIYSNGTPIWRKRLWRDNHTKADKPLASGRTPQRNRLDLPFDRTMQDDLDRPDLAKDERATVQSHAIAVLWIGDAVVAPKLFETGIAWVFTGLDAAKECLECRIDPNMNVLQDLRINTLQVRASSLPDRQHLDRIIQLQRFLALLPGLFACGKHLVIDPAARLKLLLKNALLAFGQAEAIFERFLHRTIVRQLHAESNQNHQQHNLKLLKRVKGLISHN